MRPRGSRVRGNDQSHDLSNFKRTSHCVHFSTFKRHGLHKSLLAIAALGFATN